MVYNVQNLFDDKRDGTEYREFDPSKGKWNAELYRLRVDTVAEVVRKAAPGGADLLALQEVENANALRGLIGDGLRGMGYGNSVIVLAPGSATNPAIVSRLRIARVRRHCCAGPAAGVPARDILETEIEANGAVLHLFDNHWKSRIGGARATEALRVGSADVLARRVREILLKDPAADVVVAGDFNESGLEFARWGGGLQTALIPGGASSPPGFRGSSIFLAGTPAEAGLHDGRLLLYDPWLDLAEEDRGSYYGGRWEIFDHALLSPGLFDEKGFSYVRGSFRVFKEPFLLDKNGAPKKWKGFGGQRGYSDHLPLLLSFRVNQVDIRPFPRL